MASYKGPKQRNHCEARSVSAIRQTGDVNVYWFNYRGCMEYQQLNLLYYFTSKQKLSNPQSKSNPRDE